MKEGKVKMGIISKVGLFRNSRRRKSLREDTCLNLFPWIYIEFAIVLNSISVIFWSPSFKKNYCQFPISSQTNVFSTHVITGLENSLCLSRLNVSNILRSENWNIILSLTDNYLNKLVPCDEPVVIEVNSPESQLHSILFWDHNRLLTTTQQTPAALSVLDKKVHHISRITENPKL